MPQQRDYQAEYRARRKKFRDLPARIATGHGELPPYIARKAEQGTLTTREQRIYRRQLVAYQARYGPAAAGRKGHKRPGTRHIYRGSFETEEDALQYGADLGVPDEYLQTIQRGERWRLVILR